MLINLNKQIAYVCPFCSEPSIRDLSLFELSKKARFSCLNTDCGEHCVSIVSGHNKYKITIECPICADIHTFTLSADAFLHKPVNIFKCPVSDIAIFFAGSPDKISDAMNEYIDSYAELIDPFFPQDIDIASEMLDVIAGLASEGDVSCVCGCDQIAFKTTNSHIIFSCVKCGREKAVEISESGLMALMNASAIIIQ